MGAGVLALPLTALAASTLPIVRFNTPPAIDGRLDDAAWQKAPPQSLVLLENKGNPVNPTEVRLGYDSENLYLAFVCQDADMRKLRRNWTNPEERDSDVWQDDCVEVLLDPLGTRKDFYHIIINSGNVLYDAWRKDRVWDGNLVSAVAAADDRWTVELALPFADFGFCPRGGEVWRGNLCREQKSIPEISNVRPDTRSLLQPESFAEFNFEPAAALANISLLRIMERDQGQLEWQVRNAGATDREYRGLAAICQAGREIARTSATHVVAAGASHLMIIPFAPPPGQSVLACKLTDLTDGIAVYSNRVLLDRPLPESAAAPRDWSVPEPLYEALLTDVPLGLSRRGALTWWSGNSINAREMRLFALQYGMRYVYEEMFQLWSKHDLYPNTTSGVLRNPAYRVPKLARRYGMKITLRPGAPALQFPGAAGKRFCFLPDPVCADAFIADARDMVEQYGDIIFAVNFGDEESTRQKRMGVDLFEKHREHYPFIEQVDQDVRKNYGFGKYGMPEGRGDPNPFRWIAWQRYLNDRMLQLQARLNQAVKSANPDVLVVSDDPQAFAWPLDFSRWPEHCDVVTHQLYQGLDPNRQRDGFITKYVADLTGAGAGRCEVWPCTHVENYAASFTPAEVLERLSQVFRNGGNGLHYYLTDSRGLRRGSGDMRFEYYGAPDRWAVLTNAVLELKRMPLLNFPRPDTAILYSCDTHAAIPYNAPQPVDVECAYTILGPRAGSWFQFVDDNQIERGEVDLALFKAVYVPLARYERPAVVAALKAYVEQGGVLVVADPEAFSFAPDGTDTGAMRDEFFGAQRSARAELRNGIRWNNLMLPYRGRAPRLELVGDAVPVLLFEDNTPALISRKLGNGRVLSFAGSPFNRKNLAEPDWWRFFTALQRELGAQVGQNIWRFQLPKRLITDIPLPEGKCLTGNHVVWRQCAPHDLRNLATAGAYSYSRAPDMIPDQGGASNIAFNAGDLTDRPQAYTAANVSRGKGKLDDWIVKFDAGAPVSVTFDFQSVHPLQRVRLFYQGALPDVSVLISTDGAQWHNVATAAASDRNADDVLDATLSFPKCNGRYARIEFGARVAPLALAEVEVWDE